MTIACRHATIAATALGLCLLLCPPAARAQSTINEQLWFDYIVKYPFANTYDLQFQATYKTVAGAPKWRAFENTVQVERAFGDHLDAAVYLRVAYTQQTESYNTLELRPTVQARVHVTPHSRILLRVLTRYELRNLRNQDTGDWTTTHRIRLRPEMIVPINKKSYYADKMLYGMADAEWFIQLDSNQEERFANRLRLRAGMGYKLNYTWRFEVYYCLQRSRDGIDDTFESTDNIFRFRVRHYLHKSKPAHKTLDGNE